MPPPKKKDTTSGLGRAIINRKAKDYREAKESGRYTTDADNTTRLQSVTQERDLDEFLNTAALAATDFTAERRNVKIVNAPSNTSSHNPFLLSAEEEASTLQKFAENKQRLRVPRRPPWTKSTTRVQLDRQEKDAFLEWRRSIADLQDRDKFLLTPFERNLEVWRQLWRVLERAHLVVQIVDARNPLRFRCEDLERYVSDVEGAEGEQGGKRGLRRSLLLINKADLLTARQRRLWADYFDSQGIQYAFFSALNAVALQQARRDALEAAALEEEARRRAAEDPEVEDSEDESEESEEEHPTEEDMLSEEDSDDDVPLFDTEEDTEDGRDPRAKVLSVLELEDLFMKAAPDLSTFSDASNSQPPKLVVGLVGYPNVGKSSTINALLGEKKVSVSSTPGKTKHFQTIHLSESVVLCDCPGLVFPQFATTRADLVCDGVLPIDQMREHTAPTALLVKRVPREVLEAIYGLNIKVRGAEEGGDGTIKGEDLLIPYAIARGFTRSGQGNPDEARAARYILKDYVNAKLLFCHPPPGHDTDTFNADTRTRALARAAGKKRAPITRVAHGADTFVPTALPTAAGTAQPGLKTQRLDHAFFADGTGGAGMGAHAQGGAFARARVYPHQNAVADDGTPLSGRRARVAAVVAAAGAEGVGGGKKTHKKVKRAKARSGKGYD